MRSFRVPALVSLVLVGIAGVPVHARENGSGALPAPTDVVPDADLPLPPPSLAAALKALHAGQPESAAHDLEKIHAAGGIASSGEAHFLVGRAWLAAGKPEFAVLPLRQAARDYDALPDYALFHLGEAYLAMDRPGDAAATWERLLVDFPQTVLAPRSRVRLADALAASEEWDRARELYQQAHEAGNSGTPTDELLARIAVVDAKSGKLDDAASVWFRIWREYPAGEAAKRADAELDALAALGTKVPSRTQSDVRYRRALSLSELGHAADAIAEIDALVAAKAKLPGDWRLKRALLLFKARQYPEAKKEFEKLSNSYPPGPERAESLYWYARALARQNDYAAAVKVYEKLRVQFPKVSWARDGLFKEGLMALEDKDFAAAAKYYELYSRTYPTANDADESLWYDGWSQYRAKKYDASIAAFKRLNDRFPHSQLADRSRYWTGRAQLLAGDREHGVETLSSLALEQSLTYYGLLAAGALAEAGVDIPLSVSAGVGGTDIEVSDAGDESPDPADPPGSGLAPDIGDEANVAAPPSTWRFHYSRARALVRLGYQSEAALELAAARSAAVSRVQKLELARLALAADYYHGAQNIARLSFADELAKSHGEGEIVRLAYPKAWPRFVQTYAGQYKYSPSVLWAIMREESTYRPDVVSPVGAIGLLQIMPRTGAQIADTLGVKGFTAQRLFDPEVNIGFSAWYVRNLLQKYGGNEALAIASYNAGPDAVDRWLKARGDLSLDEFVEEIPFTETRRYVKRVLMSYGIYETLYGQGAPRIRGVKPIAKSSVVGAMQVAGASPLPSPSPVPTNGPGGAGGAASP